MKSVLIVELAILRSRKIFGDTESKKDDYRFFIFYKSVAERCDYKNNPT